MVVSVAYTSLRQSFTNERDYLINTRAKRENGEVGKAWRKLTITLRSWREPNSQCSYGILLLLLSLKAIGYQSIAPIEDCNTCT